MKKALLVAALAGVGSFLTFGVVLVPGFSELPDLSTPALLFGVSSLVLYGLYTYGLALVGKHHDNYLLLVSASLFLVISVIDFGAAYLIQWPLDLWNVYMLITFYLGILLHLTMGLGAFLLRNKLGPIAIGYGVLAMVAGALLLGQETGVLFVTAQALLFLLGSALLYRASQT